MKPKFIISGVAILGLLITVFVFRNQLFTSERVLQHCSPWRSVNGYDNLCKDLNKVSNCAILNCKGTEVQKTNFFLSDPNNSDYSFSNSESIPVAIQNQIVSSAFSWAYANAPQNYSVDFIKYTPAIATPIGVTYAKIEITVTYKICEKTLLPD